MKKRLLIAAAGVALTLILALSLRCGAAWADGDVYSGVCGVNGDNLTWELSGGILTISGTGAMGDSNEFPWYSYWDQFQSLVIEEGVTSIGKYAFSDLDRLTQVTLPDSLTLIDNNAFRMSGLESVLIPAGVTTVGTGAFAECPNLTTVEAVAGNSVYAAADNVLYTKDMKTLVFCPAGQTGEISIPEGVTDIGPQAFVECFRLTRINIPFSVTDIGSQAFRGCVGLTDISLPSGLTEISQYVFKDCRFLSVEIPQGVQLIDRGAFLQCEYLASVIIPASVTEIGIGAFDVCDNLTTVYYGGTQDQWDAVSISEGNDILYAANIICSQTISGTCGADGDNLTWVLTGDTLTISGTGVMENYSPRNAAPWEEMMVTSVVINEGVTSVGNYAFTDNQDIRTVDLPDSLTSIGNSAFWGCSGIQSISIPENVTTIAIGAFGNCGQLAALEVSEQNSAYTAADNVLYSKDMTKLICCSGTKTGVFRIPQSVTAVFACAFSGCVNLTEVIIPENVPQINNQTFQNCVNLNRFFTFT